MPKNFQHLKGISMSRISLITLQGNKQEKQEARERLAAADGYDVRLRLKNAGLAEILHSSSPQEVDRLIKRRSDLTFEQAFTSMCFAIAATNEQFFRLCWGDGGDLREQALASGTAVMQLLSAKEAFWRLTPDEIAGMTAATLADTIFRFDTPRVIETCGMGGDLGFRTGDAVMKTVNASTLSAIVLASLGLPAIKHGSYANTSAVGSTDVVERFGARTSLCSTADARRIRSESGFCYFDAHGCRTIHDLSHLLKMETVNHIVGPMSAPCAPNTQINKVMGVNQKVHPESVARAYAMLHKRGILNVGGVVVLGGLDEEGATADSFKEDAFREHCILDEISPYATIFSITFGGDFIESVLVRPEDFGVSIDPDSITVPNVSDAIQKANVAALRGDNPAMAQYLAVNAACGLFAYSYAGDRHACNADEVNKVYLRECYRQCHTAIVSGRAWRQLEHYVTATGRTLTLL